MRKIYLLLGSLLATGASIAQCPTTDLTVTIDDTIICPPDSTTMVNVLSSETGVEYYLRDDSDDSVIDGPVIGTGADITLDPGTVTGPMTYNVFATGGTTASSALDFDGVDDHVVIPYDASMDLTTSWTLEAKIYPHNVTGGYMAIVSRYGSGDRPASLWIQSNKVQVWYSVGGAHAAQIASVTDIVANTWYHLVATFDGTTLSLYIDGVLDNTSTPGVPDVNGDDLEIGQRGDGSFFFDGLIEGVGYYNTVLSDGEITDHATGCISGTEAGLICAYNFEDGTGSSTLSDIGPSGFDGTLTTMDAVTDWVASPYCAFCSMEMSTLVSTDLGNEVDASVSVAGFTITADSAGLTYQWIDCSDDSPIAGETSQSFTAPTSGEYAVIVSDGPCSDTSECITLDDTGVGEFAHNMRIYPNPTNAELNVVLPNYNGLATISILELNGRVVLSTERQLEGSTRLDLSTFAKGLYILRIETEEGVIQKEIIKR